MVRSASASTATSALMKVAPVDDATSAPSADLRPLKTTTAPSLTNRSTIRLPIPLVPPVTTATLPSSLRLIVGSFPRSRRHYGSADGVSLGEEENIGTEQPFAGTSCQRLKQHLGLDQIRRVEALGEPAVDRGKETMGLSAPAL